MLGNFMGLRIKGHHRIRSNLGGFFTLICIISAIVTVCFFGEMYLSKNQISQINNIQKYWNSQNIVLDKKFKFAITNKYRGEINMRQDFWTLKAFYVNYNVKNYTIVENPITTKPCDINDWGTAKTQFELLNLTYADCYDVENLELSGNENSELFNFIRIKYTLNLDIDDIHSNWNKEMQNEIARLEPKSSFYFLEGIFDINGTVLDPQYYINTVSINLTFSNIKELEVQVSNDELIINEDKLIVTNPLSKKAYVISDYKEKISVRAETQTNSLAIDIVSSSEKSILTINFMTFSEMLARIGGIVQNLITVLFLINYAKNFCEFEINLYNDFFRKVEKDFLVNSSLDIQRKSFLNLLVKNKNENNGINSCHDYFSTINIYPHYKDCNGFDRNTRIKGINITSLNKINNTSYNLTQKNDKQGRDVYLNKDNKKEMDKLALNNLIDIKKRNQSPSSEFYNDPENKNQIYANNVNDVKSTNNICQKNKEALYIKIDPNRKCSLFKSIKKNDDEWSIKDCIDSQKLNKTISNNSIKKNNNCVVIDSNDKKDQNIKLHQSHYKSKSVINSKSKHKEDEIYKNMPYFKYDKYNMNSSHRNYLKCIKYRNNIDNVSKYNALVNKCNSCISSNDNKLRDSLHYGINLNSFAKHKTSKSFSNNKARTHGIIETAKFEYKNTKENNIENDISFSLNNSNDKLTQRSNLVDEIEKNLNKKRNNNYIVDNVKSVSNNENEKINNSNSVGISKNIDSENMDNNKINNKANNNRNRMKIASLSYLKPNSTKKSSNINNNTNTKEYLNQNKYCIENENQETLKISETNLISESNSKLKIKSSKKFHIVNYKGKIDDYSPINKIKLNKLSKQEAKNELLIKNTSTKSLKLSEETSNNTNTNAHEQHYLSFNNIINNKSKPKLSLCDYILNKYLFFHCKNFRPNMLKDSISKEKLFKTINAYYNDSMEIRNLESMFFQFNMLKYLLFSTNQIQVFENLPLLPCYSIIKNEILRSNVQSSNTKMDTIVSDLDNNESNHHSNFNNNYRDERSIDKKLYSLYLGVNYK